MSETAMTRQQRRKEIFWYILICWGISWICWTPVALSSYGIMDLGLTFPASWFRDFLYNHENLTAAHWLTVAGGLGPILGAMLVAWHFRGREAVADLWERVYNVFRSPPIWYVIAFLLMPVLFLIGTSLAAIFTGSDLRFLGADLGDIDTWRPAFFSWMITIVAMTIFIVCEEMGWRGYQLRVLQVDMSALKASLWVSVSWAYWHFPYYLLLFNPDPGNPETFTTALLMTIFSPLFLLPITVFCTFVFNSSRGSILAVMVLHASNNSATGLFSLNPGQGASAEDWAVAAQTAQLTTLIIGFIAVVTLILIFGSARLTRGEKQVIDPPADTIEKS